MTFEESETLEAAIESLRDALEEVPTDKLPHEVYRVMKGMLDVMNGIRRAAVESASD